MSTHFRTVRAASLADRQVHRWIWLALPEDAAQEAALIDLEYPSLTVAARARLLSYRLRLLRHEVWDRIVTRVPRKPEGLRPSKVVSITSYRTDRTRKSAARQKLSPERRSEIARAGAMARQAWRANG